MRKVTGNRLQATVKKIITFFLALFVFLYPIPYTLYPVSAVSDLGGDSGGLTKTGISIGDYFGFGNITSLGQATSQLVVPVFSLASVLVIIYFLIGAFKYLKSGGNKEELEGARQMITHAIIGFMILIFAFFILQFLLSSLFGVSGFRIF